MAQVFFFKWENAEAEENKSSVRSGAEQSDLSLQSQFGDYSWNLIQLIRISSDTTQE